MHKCATLMKFTFAAYESLITQLSSAHSFKAVLDLYATHTEIFKHEHVVLALRMLGRYAKQATQSDFDHEGLNQLTQRVNEIVKDLNEYDAVDVLFWLRKFRQLNSYPNMTFESQQALFNKIRTMSETQQFSFRNLVNIYYDLAFLNQNTDQIAKQLNEQLPSHTKNITPFINIQILNAAAYKIRNCYLQSYDLSIIQNIITNLENTLEDQDMEQKAQLFKGLSEIQFQNYQPKFQLPAIIRRIKAQLLEKLDQLNEDSVIWILKAYQNLPRNFDSDLLKELKDMISTTIDQNPANLKSKFLVTVFEHLNQMPFQRISYELNKKILKEIVSRVISKDLDMYQIQKLCGLLIRGPKSEELVAFIQERARENPFNTRLLDYLYINQVNVGEYIEQALATTDKKINNYNQICYYLYASRDKPEVAAKFSEGVQNFIQASPQYAVKILRELSINSAAKYHLQEQAYLRLVELVVTGEVDFNKVSRDLLNGTCNSKTRQAFFQAFEAHQQKAGKLQLNKLINNIDQIDSESLMIVLQIAQKDPASVQLPRFIEFLSNTQQRLIEIQKADHLSWVIQVVSQIVQQQQEKLKIYPIINLVNRLETIGFFNNQVRSLLRHSAEALKRNNPGNSFNDFSFINLLLSNNLLSPEDAIIEIQKGKASGGQRAKILSRALDSENCPEDVRQLGEQLAAEEAKNFESAQEDKKSQHLLNLIYLSKNKEQENENLRKKLKQYLPKFNFNQYSECVQFCNEPNLLRELVQHFSSIAHRLPVSKMIRCMVRFQSFNLAPPQVYNKLLEVLGNQFHSLTPDQRVSAMELFSQGRLKQSDFFLKNLEKILKQPQQYKHNIQQILDQLLNLGCVEQEFHGPVKALLESKLPGNNNFLTRGLCYYILAGFPIEECDKLADLIPNLVLKDQFRLIHCYEYIRRAYPESKTAKLLEQVKTMENYSQLEENVIRGSNRKLAFPVELIEQHLKALGLEVKVHEVIDGVHVDLYVPEIDTIVSVLGNNLLNFDKVSQTGHTMLRLKLASQLGKEHKIINFRDYQGLKGDESRIQHLINLGFPQKVTEIDYTRLSAKMQEKDAPE